MFDVLKYIHDNIEKKLELGDVAANFGLALRFSGRIDQTLQLAALLLLSLQNLLLARRKGA